MAGPLRAGRINLVVPNTRFTIDQLSIIDSFPSMRWNNLVVDEQTNSYMATDVTLQANIECLDEADDIVIFYSSQHFDELYITPRFDLGLDLTIETSLELEFIDSNGNNYRWIPNDI